MAEKIPERFGIQPHAYRKSANTQIVLGALVLVVTAGLSVRVGPAFSTLGLIGLPLLWLGVTQRRLGAVAQILNRAYQAVTAGQVDDAELLHAIAERNHRLNAPMRRVLAIQRAYLAVRAGDLDAAHAQLDLAIRLRVSWVHEGYRGSSLVTSALGLRSFLHAARGDAEAAQADADAVRAAQLPSPDALARVALGEALTLQRSGRRGELRSHLKAHRRLLSNHTNTRERALARGLERLVAADPESVYRKPAEKPAASPDGWVEQIAPGIASFVPAHAARGPMPEPTADGAHTEAVKKRLSTTVASNRRVAWKIGLTWLALIAMFVVAYLVVKKGNVPLDELPVRGTTKPELGSVFGVLVPAGVGGLLTYLAIQLLRNVRGARQLLAGQVQRALGDGAGARAAFETIARRGASLNAAMADRELAAVSMEEGDLEGATALVDRAIGRLSAQFRALGSDLLYPGLLEDRAVLTAAGGDSDGAAAELRVLLDELPSYAFSERARRRVTLMMAVQSGDYATAANVADSSVDIQLSAQEDLMVDVARAVAGEATSTPGEVDRLQLLLTAPSDARDWLAAIAPALLEAFEGRRGDGERADGDGHIEA